MVGVTKKQDDANEEAITELTPRLEVEGPPVLDDSTTLDADFNEEACIEASTGKIHRRCRRSVTLITR